MEIVRSLEALRAARARDKGKQFGLVPTMGALHEGHLALVAAARAECATVGASIFVNPLQFGPNEDLARYPRDEAGDLAKLEGAGCDLVWMPDVAIMYPPGEASRIVVEGPAQGWEGAVRPGHFSGVATVVARLFGQIRPDAAYFGEKDWQQLQVVRRMVADLLLAVEVRAVPTVREGNGLALSSRNRFLGEAERRAAPVLHRVLAETAAALAAGRAAAPILEQAEAALRAAGMAADYIAMVHAETMVALERFAPPARLIAAARLGTVRLLDNVEI